MRSRFLASALLLVMLPVWPAEATTVSTSMVTATSMQADLPFRIFDGPWRADPGARFVKVHVYPDEPFRLTRLEVESCDRPFAADIGLYVNFDGDVARLAGGQKVAARSFGEGITARSITLNFQENRDLCITALRAYDDKAERIVFRTPRIAGGSVVASSTLEPTASYDVMNLFDSRYESAWASNHKPSGAEFRFTFDGDETVTKIRLWNGYQRSDQHCFSNARAKTIRLTDDSGYVETITARDVMGSQTLELKRPFRGRRLTLTVVDAYPGKAYSDLAISELRFFDGAAWFMLDPRPHFAAAVAANRAAFAAAGLASVLDRGLEGDLVDEQTPASDEKERLGTWTLRLRSDGSAFVEGTTVTLDYGRSRERTEAFYALGNYEVIGRDQSGLKLRLFGALRRAARETEIEMDCNGCGRACNLPVTGSRGSEQIFQDFITLRLGEDGRVRVVNAGPKRKLNFRLLDLEVQR